MMNYFAGISDLPHDGIFQELSISHDLHSTLNMSLNILVSKKRPLTLPRTL